jgi:hypothetical protein
VSTVWWAGSRHATPKIVFTGVGPHPHAQHPRPVGLACIFTFTGVGTTPHAQHPHPVGLACIFTFTGVGTTPTRNTLTP